MSKYRFLWFQIPISGDFFQWLPAPSSVENTISQPYFFQNLETPYWKSSFPIHRQILHPPPTPTPPPTIKPN